MTESSRDVEKEMLDLFHKYMEIPLSDSKINYIWNLRNLLGGIVESEKKFDNALLSMVEIESNTKREDWK